MMDLPERTAVWPDEIYLREHFRKHRRGLRVSTVEEYDASARETIRVGVRFTYTDRKDQDTRVGYFDPWRSRVTCLTVDEHYIMSHFHATEHYVRSLLDSDYS